MKSKHQSLYFKFTALVATACIYNPEKLPQISPLQIISLKNVSILYSTILGFSRESRIGINSINTDIYKRKIIIETGPYNYRG